MIAHHRPISGIAAFGPSLIATAGYDNQIILWDAETGTVCGRGIHDHLVNQCVFSTDGRFLASSSSDYSARLWSVPDMKLLAVMNSHKDDVEGLAFHPERPVLATASRDKTVRLFDFDGQLLGTMDGHAADVLSVAWDPAGRLVSSSDDGTIAIWDADRCSRLSSIDFAGVETDTIAIAADGTIFCGNDDGEIVVVRDGNWTAFPAHKAGIKRLCIGRNSGIVASLSYDRTAAFWRPAQEVGGAIQCVGRTVMPSVVWPRSCDFLNERTVVFATFGSKYATYDLQDDYWNIDGIGDTEGINAVHFFGEAIRTVGDAGIVRGSDGTERHLGSLCNFLVSCSGHLLAGGQMGLVYDAKTGTVIYQHRSPLNCGATINNRIAIGTYTGEVLLFVMAKDGVHFERSLQVHANAVKGIAFGGNTLFSVSADASVGFTSLTTGETREIRDAHDKIANGCAALDGETFCSVSRDLTLRIWSNGDCTEFKTPHRNSIKCCAFDAESKLIATGDYTGHVGLFDKAVGEYVSFARLTTAGISSLAALPAGGGFVASSYDGKIYDVAAPHGV